MEKEKQVIHVTLDMEKGFPLCRAKGAVKVSDGSPEHGEPTCKVCLKMLDNMTKTNQ